jgi:transposase
MAGRKTKLTQEVAGKITSAVRAGNFLYTAAEFAGISKTTLFRWLQRGETDTRGIYRSFRDALKQANAEADIRLGQIILNAAADSWQAAAWIRERRWPKRWGRRDTHNVNVKQLDQLIEAELARLAGQRNDATAEDSGDGCGDSASRVSTEQTI